jgi:hypothetical protein
MAPDVDLAKRVRAGALRDGEGCRVRDRKIASAFRPFS